MSRTSGEIRAAGIFDAHGRPPLIKGDNGLTVSARIYDRYSNLLVMECKRAGDLTCENLVPTNGTTGAPPAAPTKDLFRTDETRAGYTGGLLSGYKDRATATQYAVSYLPSGKVSLTSATPTGSLAGRQNYEETYVFDAIGNVQSAQVKTNKVSGSWAGDLKETYAPRTSGSGILDQVRSTSTTKVTGTNPVSSSVEYTFDAMNRLRSINRGGTVETLQYGPSGELMAKQVGTTWTFWVGDYATVSATIPTGCNPSPCAAQDVKVDAHVIFAGTRIASLGTPAGETVSRTLYYYRSRLGTVVATSLAGGVVGARYRYTPYGALDGAASSETAKNRSELGYTNALRLSGNLLHLKTRAYDPELRVFLQVDSVDRQRYAYVRGDPANYSDPTGTRPIADGAPSPDMSWWGGVGEYVQTSMTLGTHMEPPSARAEKSNRSQCALTVDELNKALHSKNAELEKKIAVALAKARGSPEAVAMLTRLLELTEGEGVEVMLPTRKQVQAKGAAFTVTDHEKGEAIIFWDPSYSLVTTSGGVQSPVMGLLHEAGHAVLNLELLIEGRTKELEDNGADYLDPVLKERWTRPSEKKVNERFETPIARELGEPVRADHRGDLMKASSEVWQCQP